MRRMMLLGVAAIAASAAAIAVASPARSGVQPPFVDDWFSAHATAQVVNGLTVRQVVLQNVDLNHKLTHTSTVQVYLLSPNVNTPPLFTKTVTLAYAKTYTYTYMSPMAWQPVGIRIVATHIKQLNDPVGGMQPTQSATAWYPHAP